MYNIVQSENRRFTLSFLANWKLYPMNLLKGPPPPHTHTWHSIFWERRGVDFTCNTAEMFSFGPNPTRAKKAWSSSTCLLYGWTCYMDIYQYPRIFRIKKISFIRILTKLKEREMFILVGPAKFDRFLSIYWQLLSVTFCCETENSASRE